MERFMSVFVVVASSIGLMIASSAPGEAGILERPQIQAKGKLVAQAVAEAADPNTGDVSVQRKEIAEKPKVEEPEVEEPEVKEPEVKEPAVIKSCKALGLEWITPWKPKLATLRKLPAWADYVLSITATGEVQSATLLDASAKGIWKLGRNSKVLGVLLAQKITPTGAALQCNETLYFYKNSQSRKIKMPESRCGQSPEFCVKH